MPAILASSIMPFPTIPIPAGEDCFTLISIFLSSSSPCFNFSLNRSLVFSLSSCSLALSGLKFSFCVVLKPVPLTGGIKISRSMSSTITAAFSFTSSFFASLTRFTACSTKSLTIDSTSLPT